MKKIHKFVCQFDVKDKNGKTIQSGYQYIADIQKKVLEKYHDEKYIKDVLGEEKWEYYKNLMKKEKAIREKEKQI